MLASFILLCSVSVAQIAHNGQISLVARLNVPINIDFEHKPVVFDFSSLDNYKNGLGGADTPYYTKAQIAGNATFRLSCLSNGPLLHEDGDAKIDVEHIAYTVRWEDDPNTSTKNALKNRYVSLASGATTLFESEDSGDEQGELTIYWAIGKNNPAEANLLRKQLKPGVYTTHVAVLITEDI